MKQTLLERVLRKLLTEQSVPIDYSDLKRSPEEKTIKTDVETTDDTDPRKRIVIKDAPDAQIQYAEGYGAVNAFRVIFRPTKQGKDLISDNNLIDLLRDSILKHPQLGAGSKYDNGNYMYVFSENQSIKQRQVYNVWILDYAKLSSIANVINDEESSKTLKKKTNVKSIPWFMVDKIPVYTYKSAVQWLSLLKNKSKQLNLNLRDRKNLPYEFPDLTRLNRRPVDVTPIVDQRYEEQQIGSFIGTVLVTVDAYGKEQRQYYKGSLTFVPADDSTKEQFFDGEFKNGRPFKGTLTTKDSSGEIISIWQGELISTSNGGVLPNKKNGKYLSTFDYPKQIKIDNQKVLIYNALPSTSYVYGYYNDHFIKIDKTDFDNYFLNTSDPNRKMYNIEDVTDEDTINVLKTKIKIPEKKNVPVVNTTVKTEPGVITYPYTVKWLQINKVPVICYKLTDDDPDVYFYNSTGKAWYSMNRNDFETFDKVSPKKSENAPKQTKLTDSTKITELNSIAGIKTSSVTPPKKEQPKKEEPKKEVWKSGDKLIPINNTINVYERSGNTFTKQTSRSKSQILDLIFKWYTGGKYAYVDINYNNGSESETYYVLKTDVKKK